MTESLEAFHQEFARDVMMTADAGGGFKEEAFFEIVAGHLVAAGELETHERTHYIDRGLRIDGHGGHPRDSDGVLSLIIQDFDQTGDIQTLTGSDLEVILKRLTQFAQKARDASFRNGLEESSPGFEAAVHIDGCWELTRRVKLVVLTNRRLSARIDGRQAAELDGKEVITTVWDLERLHRYVASGREREDMEVDLVSEHGGAIRVLPAHLGTGDYEAFLAVVPGSQIADIYDRWGSRLLEQNVRSFLQLKGGVNKGMARTIREAPEMFFAYNNGITATAESVQLDTSGQAIERIRNFQIVNGGQTTASLHLQKSKDIDLSSVFVQMKLSIVRPERAEEVVPRISEYANTQNKVNAADFFANHPFHLELEKLSRRMLAPARPGSFVETRWFYERSRGQYVNERARLSGAALKKFDIDFPKAQLITKTDLAKVLNLWPGYVGIEPGSVCRGAQKTFSDFAAAVSRTWNEKSRDEINDSFFKECVAKTLIFRETEQIVTKRPWYQNGYRAQIVAHSIAKLAWDIEQRGDSLAFGAVWAAQGLTPSLREALTLSVDSVRDVITSPAMQGQNISEWAKMQACWQRVKDLDISWPRSLNADLTSHAEAMEEKKAAKKDKKLTTGIEAQTAVVKLGYAYWAEALRWGQANAALSHRDAGLLATASRPAGFPSEAQCLLLLQIRKNLVDAGFHPSGR